MADLAVQAQAAVSEPGKMLLRNRGVSRQIREDQIEYGPLCIHDASGQATYGSSVRHVGDQEHGPGQNR